MLSQLDLQAGLQDLADQARQQATLAGQVKAFRPGSSDQLLGPLPHRRTIQTHRRTPTCRHQPVLARGLVRRHGHDPLRPAAISRGPSDHAAYTKFLTVQTLSMTGICPDALVSVV